MSPCSAFYPIGKRCCVSAGQRVEVEDYETHRLCPVADVDCPAPSRCEGAEPALPAKRDFLIFVLAGQSNMAGRGKPLEKQDQTAHPRVLVLGKDQTWTPAVDPLHWDKPPVVGVGLGLSFGKAVAEALPDKTIGLVPAAFGGSAIGEWAKGSMHYTNAIERTKLALRDGTLAGILWHQGESDATPERAAVYASKLDRLIEDLRTDLASPEAPFIAGTLSDNANGQRRAGERRTAILARQAEANRLRGSQGLAALGRRRPLQRGRLPRARRPLRSGVAAASEAAVEDPTPSRFIGH